MARGSCARAQRGRSGRRPGRARAGLLVPGRPVNGRPGGAPVPGGADASEAGLTPAADRGAGPAGIDPDPDAELADIEWNAGHGPAATGLGAVAGPAETGPGTGAAPVET